MKLVVADPLPSSALDLLRQVPDWIVDARGSRNSDQLAADLADADALVVRSATTVDRALIERSPKLRVIARAGTGVDNVDVEAATERGIVVMNAPGANSISVAELAIGLILALARNIPAADATMKAGAWDKKRLSGTEVRGKVLGVVGLGRIGQAVAARARALGMEIIAHDPYLAEHVGRSLEIPLVSVEALCQQADFISLHLPATPETRHLFDAAMLARCKRGVRIVNTARGELIDESALADALESGQVGGAALDVFQQEPPADWRLSKMRQVIATPHIAASTAEAQELVGTETALAVREFLLNGTISNAVNFPAIHGDDAARLRPFMRLAERMGVLISELARGRTRAVGVRAYGPLLINHQTLVTNAALAGVLRPILSTGVTVVNARAVTAQRGIEVVESQSSRPRNFAHVLSLKLHTSEGEHWVEGTVFEPASPRLVQIDGVDVEASLDGTLLVINNDDQPGVIGEVGTILGRHGINIAAFALGRRQGGAIGVLNLDVEREKDLEAAVVELRSAPAIRRACVVNL